MLPEVAAAASSAPGGLLRPTVSPLAATGRPLILGRGRSNYKRKPFKSKKLLPPSNSNVL